MTYTSLSVEAPSFTGTFSGLSSLLYVIMFLVILSAAVVEIATSSDRKMVKRVGLGMLGCVFLLLIAFTLNQSLFTGDVGLTGLKQAPSAQGVKYIKLESSTPALLPPVQSKD